MTQVSYKTDLESKVWKWTWSVTVKGKLQSWIKKPILKMKCESESERQATKLDRKNDLEIFVKWSLNQPCHNDCGPQKESKPYHIVTPAEKMIFEANKVVSSQFNLKRMKVEIEKQSMRPASQTYPACPPTREIMPAEEANEITMKVSWDNQQGWGEQVYSGRKKESR